jgi:hypothetical protein
MVFTLDGNEWRAALAEGHKADGAVFDRFGLFNQQISGNGLDVWIDDLEIDGVLEDFSNDPKWEAQGNRIEFLDQVVRPIHSFGYSKSNHAGGLPGEIGGIVWRIESVKPENAAYYGVPVGRLTLDDELRASGKVALCGASSDSGVLIGWFNSLTPIGGPPSNFVGLFVEGPSRIGHYFRPAYGTATGMCDTMNDGPVIHPDSVSHSWTLHFDPKAGDGHGRITVGLDDETIAMDVPANAMKANAVFDRFGLVTWHYGGHFVEIYFDDLTFSSRTETGE